MERPLHVVRSEEEMRVTTWSGIATGKTDSTATAEQQRKSETVKSGDIPELVPKIQQSLTTNNYKKLIERIWLRKIPDTRTKDNSQILTN